jgi:hypothetical protein
MGTADLDTHVAAPVEALQTQPVAYMPCKHIESPSVGSPSPAVQRTFEDSGVSSQDQRFMYSLARSRRCDFSGLCESAHSNSGVPPNRAKQEFPSWLRLIALDRA